MFNNSSSGIDFKTLKNIWYVEADEEYKDVEAVEKNTIKYESEDNELSLRMHIITERGTNILLFNYERIKNKNVLHVVGNIGDESINYYIYFHEDGYQYILGN